jgi:hypothetical protein
MATPDYAGRETGGFFESFFLKERQKSAVAHVTQSDPCFVFFTGDTGA